MTNTAPLRSFFKNAYMAPIIAGLVGCASVQHNFDPETCKTWTEGEAKTFMLNFSTRSKDTFNDACTEGKAGAQVTIVARKNGELNPISASIGKEFLTIVRENAARERAEKDQELADKRMTSESTNFPSTEEEQRKTRSEEILDFFAYYLKAAGYSEEDMDKAIQRALEAYIEKQESKCTFSTKGLICE